jgi:hypothetical protein
MGAMVTGVDGLAGRDYLRHGENCLVGSIRDLRTLPGIITQAFRDEKKAAECAARGQITARLYGFQPYKAAWLRHFSEFLQVEPHNV